MQYVQRKLQRSVTEMRRIARAVSYGSGDRRTCQDTANNYAGGNKNSSTFRTRSAQARSL